MLKAIVRALSGALVASTAILAASAASATSYNIMSFSLDPKVGGVTTSATFSYNNGSYKGQVAYGGVEIGRLQLTGNVVGSTAKVAFDTYCIDVVDELAKGVFSDGTVSAGTNLANLSSTRLSQLTAWLEHVSPMVTDATTSAAAQLGVWDILYDNSGSYGTASGFFTETLGRGGVDAMTQTNTWIANINSGAWTENGGYRLAVLMAPSGNQSQVYLSAAPEPASWAMMIIGFGAIGAALRRRRGSVALA